MIKLRSKRLSKSNSNIAKGGAINSGSTTTVKGCGVTGGDEIKWEVRPGGMLVQKRDCKESDDKVMITIRVSTVSKWHDISVEATSTFGKSQFPIHHGPLIPILSKENLILHVGLNLKVKFFYFIYQS